MKVTSTLKESPFRLDEIFFIYRYFTSVPFSHNRCPLAQLDKRRSAEREAFGSNLGRTNTQGLQITE